MLIPHDNHVIMGNRAERSVAQKLKFDNSFYKTHFSHDTLEVTRKWKELPFEGYEALYYGYED